MSLHVCCASCGRAFSALRHAGLVRCRACDERLALRLPGQAAGTTVVLDTPGEAWA